MAEQNADCGIAALLRAATSEYLKGCELDEDPAEAATLPIAAAPRQGDAARCKEASCGKTQTAQK